MRVAVLKAKFTDNPNGLPDEWPVKANPLKEGQTAEGDWVEMDIWELKAMQDDLRPQYDQFKKKLDDKIKKEKKDKEDQENGPKVAIKNKFIEVGFTDEQTKIIMGKNYPA